MDKNDKNLISYLKEPYVRYSIILTIIIILTMYSTQPYWMNTGIKQIYPEYTANETFFKNNHDIPDGIFILSGNYSYISYWINTSKVNCNTNGNVKLLVYSKIEFASYKSIVVIDSVEGCKLNK